MVVRQPEALGLGLGLQRFWRLSVSQGFAGIVYVCLRLRLAEVGIGICVAVLPSGSSKATESDEMEPGM